MKFTYLLKLATRTFRTRPKRTFLTILGVSIGIGAIFVFVSLGYGLQKLMLEQITTAESLLSLDVTVHEAGIISLDQEKLSDIAQIPNVEEVSPLAIIQGQLSFGELTSDTLFYACRNSYFNLGGIVPKIGSVFNGDNEKKVVLSSALVRSFGLEENEVLGKEVRITIFMTSLDEFDEEIIEAFELEKPYKISGIIKDETTSFLYLPLDTLQDFEITEYSQVKVKVSNMEAVGPVSDSITDMGYSVLALSENIDQINKVFQAIQIVLGIFGLVALFVAAIGMVNTMTVTLLERINEIGIMKAIGASDKDIGKMFLVESLMIGFSGGIGGIILGFLVSRIFNLGINMLAQSFGGQPVNLFYTPLWFIAFIVIFSTLVGFFSGIIPSKRASGMNPLEALRYK